MGRRVIRTRTLRQPTPIRIPQEIAVVLLHQ
jgi:hypothetical protein